MTRKQGALRVLGTASLGLWMAGLAACAARQPPVAPNTMTAALAARPPDDPLAEATEVWRRVPTAAHAVDLAARLRERRVFDQAVTVLTAAVKNEPRSALAHQHLALAWLEWGVPAQAAPHAQRAVFFAPSSADAAAVHGRVLAALDRWPEAHEAFGRTVQLDSASAAGWANWAYAAYRLGDEAAALQRGAEALRRDPSLAVVRNNLALVHASAGRFDDAERELTAATGEADGQYNLGLLHMARHAFADAVKAFERALVLRPEFDEARTRLRHARARLAGGGEGG